MPGAIEFEHGASMGGTSLLRQEGPVTSELTLCGSRTNGFEVTILDVRAETLEGTDDPVEFLIDWAGAPDDELDGSSAPPPASFEPAIGSTGEIGDCNDGDGARLAYVTPAVADEPIVVGDFVIVYESDGEEARTSMSYTQTQCPMDRQVDTRGCDER